MKEFMKDQYVMTTEIHLLKSYQLKIATSVCIKKNLKTLATEIFKEEQRVSREIISELFRFIKKSYTFRNNSMLQRKKRQNQFFSALEVFLTSLASKIWDLLPGPLKIKFA